MAMIRWKRIRSEASKLAGKPVAIHGTTELSQAVRAFVKDEAGSCDIMLNMMLNKSEMDVVSSVAHELAHITLGDPGHNEAHDEETKRLQRSLNIALAKGAK